MINAINTSSEILMPTAENSVVASIVSRIYSIRGKQVMLDRDLAELYGITTGNLNKAVSRNTRRFPEDFMFTLTNEEWSDLENLLFQNGISKHGGTRYAPHVFTEHGVVVLANILKSDIAIDMSIKITRAFVSMRHYILSGAGHEQRLQALERKQMETSVQIDAILDRMQNVDFARQLSGERLFANGCVFDAWTFLSDLVRTAKTAIHLIDNYVDDRVLALFSERTDGVSITIHTRYTLKFTTDLEKYNQQYPSAIIRYEQLPQKNHDRFLLIDDVVYMLGSSVKDLGNSISAIIRMNDTSPEDVLLRLKDE